MKEWLGRLRDHMEWADATVIASLRKQGASPKVEGIMGHLLAAGQLWLARARDKTTQGILVWPRLSLSECAHLAEDNSKGYREMIVSADESGLARGIPYTNSKGQRFESRLDDVLLHVFMHGSYHRGQIAVLQRTDGREPAYTDYIHYVRTIRAPGEPGAQAVR